MAKRQRQWSEERAREWACVCVCRFLMSEGVLFHIFIVFATNSCGPIQPCVRIYSLLRPKCTSNRYPLPAIHNYTCVRLHFCWAGCNIIFKGYFLCRFVFWLCRFFPCEWWRPRFIPMKYHSFHLENVSNTDKCFFLHWHYAQCEHTHTGELTQTHTKTHEQTHSRGLLTENTFLHLLSA